MVGVGYFIWQLGTVPWIGLGLAITFAFYGLLRKVVQAGPLVGLAVETLLITPVVLLFVSYLATQGTSHFGETPWKTLLFMGGGSCYIDAPAVVQQRRETAAVVDPGVFFNTWLLP